MHLQRPLSLSQFLTDESGDSLVAMAMALTIMLGFTFGIIQVGLGYYNKERISESAREGARYAILHGSTCTTSTGSCTATAAQVQTWITNLGYPNMGGGTMTPTVTYPDGDEAPGHRVTVSVSYSFPFKIPFVNTTALTFSSSSTMYILI